MNETLTQVRGMETLFQNVNLTVYIDWQPRDVQ